MKAFPRLRALARRLHRNQSGLALIEFAFAGPIVIGIGLYGVENASLALANMRVSQTALNTADNASRLGLTTSSNIQQMREFDVNDVIAQIRKQTAGWELTKRGRVTITSLEEKDGKQIMHWQRCVGRRNGVDYDSHYGTTSITAGSDDQPANAGTEAVGGMGPAGAKVVAPTKSGIMFVEVNYEYKPVVSDKWLPAGTTRLHYIASFIVRDRRDFTQIFNPDPQVQVADKMTCNFYTE